MKKISFFSLRLMLLVALCCFSFRAMADEVTVYDGTATSTLVPVYGNWADSYVRSQCIYSADDLSAAGIEPGAAIQSVTFYLYSTADVAWTSLWDVNVVETTTTSLASGFVTLEDATTVLGGALLSAVKPTLTLEFEAPYIYQGGNLVLDVRNQAPGNYSSASFYGTSVSGGSRAGYSYSGTNSVTGYDYSFAPKTTFRYEASSSSCPRPDFINVEDITAYSARLNWEGTAPSYELTVNGVSTIETATEKQLTLAPFTRYNVSVRAICAEGDTSMVRSTSFVSAKTCLAPDTVYFTEPTIDGNTTLTWSGDASMYYLLVSDGGNLLYNDRIGANSFDITGLTTGRHNFYVYLSAQCGPRVYEQSDTLNLTLPLIVPAAPLTTPWFENFDNYSSNTVPAGWDNGASTSSSLSAYPYYLWGVYSSNGNNTMRMNNNNAQSGEAIIYSPAIQLPADVASSLTFEYCHMSNGGDMVVSISTDNCATFTALGEYQKGDGSSYNTPGEMTEVSIDLAAYAGQVVYLQFAAHANYGNGAIFVDNIFVGAVSACPKTADVFVGEIGQTEAQILWNAVEGVTEYAVVVTAGNVVLFNQTVQDTVITLQNLSPSSSYSVEVSVSSVCSATDSSYPLVKKLSFATECGPITVLPWSEDFESMPLGNNTSDAPACWGLENANKGSYPYVYVNNSSSYVHNGSKSLYFVSSSTDYAYAFLPEFGVALNTTEIDFWYKDESTSSSGYLDLGYMNDGEFVSIASYTRSSSWKNAHTMLNELPETVTQLCFRYGGASNNYYLGIDDIIISALPTCLPVADINVESVGVDSAVLAWNAVEGAQGYRVSVNAEEPVLVTEPSFVINDLEQGTTYSFYVAVTVVCSDDDESAEFSKSLIFLTQVPPVTAPYYEGFNDIYSGVPEGWDNNQGTTTSSSYKFSSNAAGYVGRGLLFDSYYNTDGNTNKLVSPSVLIPSDGYTLSFWVKNPTGGAYSASLLVDGVLTVLDADMTDISSWTQKSFSMDEYVGKNVQLVLDATSNWGSGDAYLYFDEFAIEKVPTCFPVQEVHLVAGSVTGNDATLAWTPAEEGGENFHVTVLNGSDTIFNGLVNDTILALTELAPATAYNLAVSVQTICADDDVARAVFETISFQTECVVLAAPYFTSFEDGAACWELGDGISAGTSYSYYYEGYGVLKFTATRERYAVLPEMEDLNGNRFTMYYRNEGNGPSALSGSFLMGYMIGNQFVALSDSLPKVFEMTEAFVDFVDVPAGARAAIKYYGASSANWSGYVDNVEVAAIPTCFPASNLRVDSIGRDFVTLAWSPAASETGYNIVVSQWGDTLANAYVQDTVFTVTGLRHSYPYYNVLVDITSVCGEDDLAKTYSSTITFTTECGVNVIDYYTPFRAWFSGADLKSNCYNTYGTGNAEGWVVAKNSVDLGEFTTYNYATVPYATDTVRVTSVLELPLIGLTAGKHYELNFWAKGTDYQTDDTIAVYVNDELVMAANANEIGGEWVNIIDTISGDGESLVSFRYSSFFGYSFSIAELVIRELYEFAPSTFEDLQVDENGIFRPYDKSGWNSWISGSQEFATYVNDSYGTPYYSDVTVSSLKDTTFTNDFSAGYDMKSACGTAAEGNQYAVWYNNWYSEGVSVYFRQPEVVSGMYVTNNTYLVNSILNGDSFAKKFTTGDWFKLTVNGFNYADYDGDGRWELEKVGSVDFYLADFRNPMDYKYASDWMWLDLTSLGEVTNIGFELTSSDNGDYGMNTPAYFCFDNLGGVAPAQSADYRHIINLPENLWIIGECATANWNPSASMQMTKVADGVFEVIETLTGTWFAFSGSNSSNWDEVNALRFGANPSGATVTLGQAEAITGVAGEYCFTVPAAGTYKFVVDLNAMTVTVTAVTALDNVDTDNVAEKFFRDNQVLIRKNGKTHNVLGQQVR